MDQAFSERMKEELQSLREEIVRHLAAETEGFRAIVEDLDPKDVVDMASDDVDKKNIEALNAVESRRLQLIENALSRIQSGHYGVCMDCTRSIPRPRLEAIPYALFCIECQEKRDRQGR